MNHLFRFGLVFVLSFIAFGEKPMGLESYLLPLAIVGGLFIMAFSAIGNLKCLRNFGMLIAGNFTAYLSSLAIYKNDTFQETVFNSTFWSVVIPLVIFYICMLFQQDQFISQEESTEVEARDDTLFKEHKYDIERISSALKHTDILGINASWGEGKTFVVDHFCKQENAKGTYHIVKIETLAYKYDEFDQILISKLDQLLRDNRIFSMRAAGLRNAILGVNFGNLGYRFFEGVDSEETSTYESIKRKIQYLDKPVLVIFEDLERADDPAAVKKIFAIVERMACHQIKFIYEYDAKALDDQKIDYNYRNKYIPLEMKLTEIPYSSLVKYSYNPESYPNINSAILKNIRDVLFCTYTGPLSQYARFKMNDFQKFFTARIVGHFLRDINGQLTDEIKKDSLQLKTIIGFYFIKNFMHDQYDEIRPLTEMEKTFAFTYRKEEWSIGRLCKEIKGCKDGIELATEVMKDPQNRFHYMVLCLLEHGYISNANDNENELKIAKTIDVDTRLLEDRKWMKAFEDRDRINHIVWNLTENGSSEHTNNEAAIKRFVNFVLSADESCRGAAWNQYCADLYNEDFYKNNSTIFLIGVNPLVSLSRGLNLNHVSDSIWIKFFDFCEWELGLPEENLQQNDKLKKAPEEAVKKMKQDEVVRKCYVIIDLLSYADVRNFEVFLKALKLFLKYVSKEDISGNFNQDANYRDFLHKFLLQMKYFGLIYVSQLGWMDSFPETMAEDNIFKECIRDALQDIEDSKRVCDSGKMTLLDEAFDLAENFIRTNESIIYKKTPMRRPPPFSISISTSSLEGDEKIFHKISNMLPKKQDDLTDEIKNQYVESSESEYKKGKLRPGQLIHLMDKLHDLKNRTKNNTNGD